MSNLEVTVLYHRLPIPLLPTLQRNKETQAGLIGQQIAGFSQPCQLIWIESLMLVSLQKV